MSTLSNMGVFQATEEKNLEDSKSCSRTGKVASGKVKYAHKTLDFGVPAAISHPHHFKVVIPKNASGRIPISEYLGLEAASDTSAVIHRVALERSRWMAIRSEIQRAFNARLRAQNLKSAVWKTGENHVDRLLGRELCVLAWAVESMEMGSIPVAVRNWLGLRPEERWWLFGMTAMNTGYIKDGNKGWRLALRHALGDVAQRELFRPLSRNDVVKPESLSQRDLFGGEVL